MLDYYLLRKSIYSYQIRQLNEQLKKFSLLLFTLFWTAVPAIFYSLLVGLGIIMSNVDDVLASLPLVWIFLTLQSMLILTLKGAILGCENHLFLASLNRPRFMKVSASALLALASSPILLMSLIISFSIPIDRWWEAKHAWLFIFLQTLTIAISLINPTKIRLYWFISLLWLLISLFIDDSGLLNLTHHLLVFIAMLGACHLVNFAHSPNKPSRLLHKLPVYTRYWCEHAISQSSLAFLILCFNAIVMVGIIYLTKQVPNYTGQVFFVGVQIVILLSASIQFAINQNIDEYDMFYKHYLANADFRHLQYLFPLLLGGICIGLYSVFLQNQYFIWLDTICLFMLVYIVKQHKNWFAIGWLFLSALSAWLRFFVFN